MLFAQVPVDLIKLLPDGANVVAVIVVIYLFLKQQDKSNEVLKAVQTAADLQANASQKAFQDQISALSNQYFTNQKAYQDQIQRLMDGHILVTRDAIVALQELKGVVVALRDGQTRQIEKDK